MNQMTYFKAKRDIKAEIEHIGKSSKMCFFEITISELQDFIDKNSTAKAKTVRFTVCTDLTTPKLYLFIVGSTVTARGFPQSSANGEYAFFSADDEPICPPVCTNAPPPNLI